MPWMHDSMLSDFELEEYEILLDGDVELPNLLDMKCFIDLKFFLFSNAHKPNPNSYDVGPCGTKDY